MRKVIGLFLAVLALFAGSFALAGKDAEPVIHVFDPFMDVLTDNKKYIGIILKPKDKDIYISECLKDERIVGTFKNTEEAYNAIIKNCGI